MSLMKDVFHNRKKAAPWWRPLLLYGAVALLLLLIFLAGVKNTAASNQEERLALADRAVRRAVISCYAVEGFYPPDVEYLQEHYGLSVDEDRYIIHYEAFASNVFPIIEVMEMGGEG